MCGIVGLFAKTDAVMQSLGLHVANMLSQMGERGPDSAGIAIYNDPARGVDAAKLTVQSDDQAMLDEFSTRARNEFDHALLRQNANHLVLEADASAADLEDWARSQWPELRVMSAGTRIEIYKEKGHPAEFADRYSLSSMQGSHALAHTRMATESAITTSHSHPFSTGLDLCLVHNGSLSNHNRLRELLQKRGIRFDTDNDSEVAAGYLTWRLSEGDSLKEALGRALKDLDGFYTFAIGTRDGFAVLRDPIACKPAVMAETAEWVAMSSEYRAIAQLPGAENARVWEPEPARIYTWEADNTSGVAA